MGFVNFLIGGYRLRDMKNIPYIPVNNLSSIKMSHLFLEQAIKNFPHILNKYFAPQGITHAHLSKQGKKKKKSRDIRSLYFSLYLLSLLCTHMGSRTCLPFLLLARLYLTHVTCLIIYVTWRHFLLFSYFSQDFSSRYIFFCLLV